MLANDQDADGDTLAANIDTPALGEWTLQSDGSFRYMPPANFNGLDLASYRASDETEASLETLVQFRVLPVNDLPESNPDRYFALAGQELDVPVEAGVLANDVDVDGDRLSAEIVDGPTDGSVTLNPDGSFRYEPRMDFEGERLVHLSCGGRREFQSHQYGLHSRHFDTHRHQ